MHEWFPRLLLSHRKHVRFAGLRFVASPPQNDRLVLTIEICEDSGVGSCSRSPHTVPLIKGGGTMYRAIMFAPFIRELSDRTGELCRGKRMAWSCTTVTVSFPATGRDSSSRTPQNDRLANTLPNCHSERSEESFSWQGVRVVMHYHSRIPSCQPARFFVGDSSE